MARWFVAIFKITAAVRPCNDRWLYSVHKIHGHCPYGITSLFTADEFGV